MVSRKPLWSVIVAGALVPLALEPWGFAWVLPISFAILAWTLKDASLAKGFWFGWLFGLAVEAVGLPWISTTVSRYLSIFVYEDSQGWIASLMGAGAFLVRCPIAALGWALCCASITLCPKRLWLRALWAGLCFMVLEAYWPRLFPWSIGSSYATEDPTGGWLLLQWFGVEETLFLIVGAGFLASSVFQEDGRSGRRRWYLLPAVLLMLMPLLPLPAAPVASSQQGDSGEPLTVSVVQPAIPLESRHGRDQIDVQLKKIRQLIEIASDGGEAPEPSLILLPEGILPQSWKIEWLRQWSQDWLSRPTVIGLSFIEPDGFSNAVALLVPGENTVAVQIGRKKVLVPFGETIPQREFLSSLGIEVPITPLVAGKEEVIFAADDHFPKLGVSICYEGILSGVASATVDAGARWHANLTEDLWYGDWLEPAQHLQLQRSRAIETGLVWLRSVNAGISAVIDPRAEGQRSILSSRSWSQTGWSKWRPRSAAGQVSIAAKDPGILQVQIDGNFSPRQKAPLALPSSSPLLLVYCLLGLFWFNLRRFQADRDRSSRT